MFLKKLSEHGLLSRKMYENGSTKMIFFVNVY